MGDLLKKMQDIEQEIEKTDRIYKNMENVMCVW